MPKVTALRQADRYGDLSVAEVEILKELVRELPRRSIIVNIGAGNRAISTLAMLEEKRDAFIFSIDVKVKENEQIYLAKAQLPGARVVRILGKSQRVGKFWPIEVDFVFVDGDHTYKGVRGDLVWMSKVKVGGIIAFHDYSPPKPRKETKAQLTKEGDVKRAVDEYVGENWEEIAHVHRIKAFRRIR